MYLKTDAKLVNCKMPVTPKEVQSFPFYDHLDMVNMFPFIIVAWFLHLVQ